MTFAIGETNRRRTIQETYNREHNIEPQSIIKSIRDLTDRVKVLAESKPEYATGGQAAPRVLDPVMLQPEELQKLVKQVETEMKAAAKARLDSIDIAQVTLGGHAVTELVTIDGYKFVMDDGGWLLLRFSGTEPLIRVYTETTREDLVPALLDGGLEIAGLKD